MKREDIKSKLVKITVEMLGVDEVSITEETSFVEDLGADSLDIVELVMEIEEVFDIEIPDEEAESLTSVSVAIDYLEKNL